MCDAGWASVCRLRDWRSGMPPPWWTRPSRGPPSDLRSTRPACCCQVRHLRLLLFLDELVRLMSGDPGTPVGSAKAKAVLEIPSLYLFVQAPQRRRRRSCLWRRSQRCSGRRRRWRCCARAARLQTAQALLLGANKGALGAALRRRLRCRSAWTAASSRRPSWRCGLRRNPHTDENPKP